MRFHPDIFGCAAQLYETAGAVAGQISCLRLFYLCYLLFRHLERFEDVEIISNNSRHAASEVCPPTVGKLDDLHPHSLVQTPDGLEKAIPQFTRIAGIREGDLSLYLPLDLQLASLNLFPQPLPDGDDLKGRLRVEILAPDVVKGVRARTTVADQTFYLEPLKESAGSFDGPGERLEIPKAEGELSATGVAGGVFGKGI